MAILSIFGERRLVHFVFCLLLVIVRHGSLGRGIGWQRRLRGVLILGKHGVKLHLVNIQQCKSSRGW